MFGFVNLIPKTIYAAAVAALLALSLALGAGVAHLRVEVAHGETRYAQLETKLADEAKERERVARENALEIKRMQEKHASQQQETVHAFQAQAAADRERIRAQRTELDGLRDTVRAYASGSGVTESDSVACRSARDRSERLGGLVEEALELQGQSESFIRQRDREVKLLKEIISNDRVLTQDHKEPQ